MDRNNWIAFVSGWQLCLQNPPKTILQPVKAYIRIDDGEKFTINPDGTYSIEKMKRDFPDHLHHKTSAKRFEYLVARGLFQRES